MYGSPCRAKQKSEYHILKRHRINKQDIFDRVVKFIIENVGKTFSANAIAKFLNSKLDLHLPEKRAPQGLGGEYLQLPALAGAGVHHLSL